MSQQATSTGIPSGPKDARPSAGELTDGSQYLVTNAGDGNARELYEVNGDQWDSVPWKLKSLATEEESNVYKIHNWPGADLSEQLSNALADAPKGTRLQAEPPDDGSKRQWGSKITVDPNAVGAATIDFGGTQIDVTVSNPLIATGDSLALNDGSGLTVTGGVWDMPDTGDVAVSIRDAFSVTVNDIINIGNNVAAVSIENHDSWSEYADVSNIYAIGGAGALDCRPASVTGGSGTESFINASIHRLWSQNFTDFGTRWRGDFKWSDIGFMRADPGADNSIAHIFDANFAGCQIGPVREEDHNNTSGVYLAETRDDYSAPARFVGLAGGDPINRTAGAHVLPTVGRNPSGSGLRWQDKGRANLDLNLYKNNLEMLTTEAHYGGGSGNGRTMQTYRDINSNNDDFDVSSQGGAITYEINGSLKFRIKPNGKIELFEAGDGVVMRSPDGSPFELTIANDGTVTTTAL